MKYNFDTVVDRRSTNSIKWTKYPEDVLPMWVADMDFLTPKPILDTLQAVLEQCVLGYEDPSLTLREVVCARMDRLYGWKIKPEMVVATPGVVSGFNAAARAVCEPGDAAAGLLPIFESA